jgi:hypothetical protein
MAMLHARHVFMRRDAAKLPLAPAYDGPYLVLERSPHTSGSSSATGPMWSLLLASKLLFCRRTRLPQNHVAVGGLPVVRLFYPPLPVYLLAQLSVGPHRVHLNG